MWQHDMFEATEKLFETERQQLRKRENLEPATINISNLHQNVLEKDLHDLFSLVGKLQEVHIDFDKAGRSMGNQI